MRYHSSEPDDRQRELERALVRSTLGFDFAPEELQTVNADDLLRLVRAARDGAPQAVGGEPLVDEQLPGLRSWLVEQADRFAVAPWCDDVYVKAHIAQLRGWATALAAKVSTHPSSAPAEQSAAEPHDAAREARAELSCLPNGLPSDAFGEPRVRHVRITLNGSHLVMTPAEADAYMADAKANEYLSAYVLRDVYLSEREAENLPEFDGF